MKPVKSVYKKYFKTIALAWAGCFIVFVLVNILVLAPQRKNRTQIAKQLAEKKKVYDSALNATREDTKLKLSKQVDSLRDELKGYVADSEDSANITFDISQIANGKKVASFSVKTEDERRGAADIPNCNYIGKNRIDVTFTAGFNQFAGFLNALERHRPLIFVDEFTISRSKRGDTGHQVSMDLAVLVKKRQDS